MAITGSRVTVATSPTLLARASESVVTVIVKNLDATNAIDLGGATVATGAGFQLAATLTSPAIVLQPGDELYGVCAAATIATCVLKRA